MKDEKSKPQRHEDTEVSEKTKQYFLTQMERCRTNMETDKGNVRYWRAAAEMYEHLSFCPLSHTEKNDGRKKCDYNYWSYPKVEERMISA